MCVCVCVCVFMYGQATESRWSKEFYEIIQEVRKQLQVSYKVTRDLDVRGKNTILIHKADVLTVSLV